MIFISFFAALICIIGSVIGLTSNPTENEQIILIIWFLFGVMLFVYTIYWYNKRRKQGKEDNCTDCLYVDCPTPAINRKTFDCDRDGDCNCGPDCSS
ncbi:hypothetical protein BTO30_06730 [Domibacillus antri]|uniref:Uncharacterized protein n=1 Tax=Domibacillus antri TaxID=1714264 RepID=A0A1Q8Q6G9_9BACI|nr:hypothetical protein BTO30_06730 [Domibacillus antri]